MSETSNDHFIVTHDPENEYWDGSLVGPAVKNQLEARGVVLLPTLPTLFRLSGVGGYMKRAWGAGLSLGTHQPRMHAPLTMYCSAQAAALHWAARLIPEPDFLKKLERDIPELLVGFLKISIDASQVNANKAGLTPRDSGVDIRALSKMKLSKNGDFIVQGSATVRCPTDGHYGFGLFGHAPGLRVVWAAVSQAAQ